MTKYEFLERLRQALANDLGGAVIQENVSYYDNYISDEVRKGRSEAAVIDELGDPWAIAKTIIESVEIKGNVYEEHSYEPRRQNYYEQERQRNGGNVHVFGLDAWWKKLLLILGIAGVIMVVVAVIGGIVSLLAPILVPLLVIMFIIRLIGGNRR